MCPRGVGGASQPGAPALRLELGSAAPAACDVIGVHYMQARRAPTCARNSQHMRACACTRFSAGCSVAFCRGLDLMRWRVGIDWV